MCLSYIFDKRTLSAVFQSSIFTVVQVQEENQALVAKYEGFDHEMTKETVARLSKLISAKDLEIESLRQKCQTLLDVLQQQEQRQGMTFLILNNTLRCERASKIYL